MKINTLLAGEQTVIEINHEKGVNTCPRCNEDLNWKHLWDGAIFVYGSVASPQKAYHCDLCLCSCGAYVLSSFGTRQIRRNDYPEFPGEGALTLRERQQVLALMESQGRWVFYEESDDLTANAVRQEEQKHEIEKFHAAKRRDEQIRQWMKQQKEERKVGTAEN